MSQKSSFSSQINFFFRKKLSFTDKNSHLQLKIVIVRSKLRQKLSISDWIDGIFTIEKFT